MKLLDLPLAGKVQTVGAVIPERHADTGDGVQVVEATDGLVATWLPERKLPVAHAGETRCRNTVLLAHPHGTAVLGALVAGPDMRRLLLADIPHAQLLVSRGRDHEVSGGVP